MASQTERKDYEFERTLMHGRFHSDLQAYAREVAAHQQQREREEYHRSMQQQKRKTNKIWYMSKKYILPYVVDWAFILLLGILMALLSFVIDYLIEQLGKVHIVLSLELTKGTHPVLMAFLWVAFPALLVLFSVGFTHLVSIHAIGSGIPEMKTVLRGVNLTDYLSFKTFIAKSVALITAVGSSLPIGKEGPFVHLSSIIADIMSRLLSRYVKLFNHVFANEAHTNELLAAACAIGVSSNFAAPIGGVLFSIEVTSTYFAVRNYWRGFFGAVCGAFLFRLAAVWFKSEATITALFKTSFNVDIPFDPVEMFFFAFIGIAAGIASAMFVLLHRQFVLTWRKYRKFICIRILEYNIFVYPLLLTLVITALTFPLGLGQFMAGELTQRQALEQLFSNFSWTTIAPSKEDLPDDSFRWQVLNQWGNTSIFLSLVLFIVFKFLATTVAVALPIPAGVFFPVFLIGAAFGRLVGEVVHLTFQSNIIGHVVNPGGYAVVGAAAMAGGVTHTISTSVIVFELTGQITHILPVMVAVLFSNAIASMLQPSFYDSIIMIKQLPFLPDLKLHKYYNLYAKDIMRGGLQYVSHETTYRDLRHLLKNSKHASYPLVDHQDSKILLGSVSRNTLRHLLNEHMQGVYKHAREIRQKQQQLDPEDGTDGPPRSPGRQSPTHLSLFQSVSDNFTKLFNPSHHEATDAAEHDLAEVIESETESSEALVQLEDHLLSVEVQFPSHLIDPSPFQLVEMTSLYKIHSLFSLLSLSHAYVTSLGKLVGVVTLSDLSDAIEGKQTIPRTDSISDSPKQHGEAVYRLTNIASEESDTDDSSMEPETVTIHT